MDALLKTLDMKAEYDCDRLNASGGGPYTVDQTTVAIATKLLRECQSLMQSLVAGDPQLAPSEVLEKHQEWAKELLA